MPQIFSESNTLRIQNASTKTTLTFAETANRVITYPDITDTLVSKNTTDTLTNKTATGATNTLTAKLLKSATTEISISAATAPTTGQVLTATNSTTATWQTPSGGGGGGSSETITAAGALSTTVDSIINTSTGPLTVTLANGTANQLKMVRLLYRTGSNALITTTKGSILLTPSEPIRHMRYTTNGWVIEEPDNDNFFPTVQQGNKLVGVSVHDHNMGSSISISADGNTFAVNEPTYEGLVRIFIRSGSSWSEQAQLVFDIPELAPTTNIDFGTAVALSADGNTVAITAKDYFTYHFDEQYDPGHEAPIPDALCGALFIFVRSGSSWSQQAGPLYDAAQLVMGFSVAISSDGNTVAMASHEYNNGNVMIFVRSGASWSQQGSTFTSSPTDNIGKSVSLSANGNILAVGGGNGSSVGSAWIFNRVGSTWTQQIKLVGTNNVGNSYQGQSVCLSADGNTLAVGGQNDDSGKGATWIFVRLDGTWTQGGIKLRGTGGGSGAVNQGYAVALSSNGKTLAIAAPLDTDNGSVTIFIRSGNTWIQRSRITGTGTVYNTQLAYCLSLSSNGNTLVAGAYPDNNIGAVYVFV